VFDIPRPEAIQIRDAALLKRSDEINAKFAGHRAEHNKELYPDGGSPTNVEVWQQFQTRPLKVLGGI
jgi:hypothetical protein